MNKNTYATVATLAVATLSFSPVFGHAGTNDFESEVSQTENPSNSWNLSIELFYATSLDEYLSGDNVNLIGSNFSFSNTMPISDKVALELGILFTLDYGTDTVLGIDLTQADFMVGPHFGLCFNPSKNISISVGTQIGLDVRYGEIEYGPYSDDDTGFGTFLGLYAGPKIKLSESCDLSFTARYVKTEVNNLLEGDYNMDYLMFGVGVNFKF